MFRSHHLSSVWHKYKWQIRSRAVSRRTWEKKQIVQWYSDRFNTLSFILAGVTLYGGPKASSLLEIEEAPSFHHEYSSRACTVEIVSDVGAAIAHIHKNGRHVSNFQFSLVFVNWLRSFITLRFLFLFQCAYWLYCDRRQWSCWTFPT